MTAFTGLWEFTGKLKGSSYKLKNVDTSKDGKRHFAHLSPYPDELLPFIPVNGPDNVYGQLNSPIKENSYPNAGLKEFMPLEPHQETDACLAIPKEEDDPLSFLSLAELNADLFDWHDGEEDAVYADESLCAEIELYALTRSHAAAKKRPPLPPDSSGAACSTTSHCI